MKFQFRSLGFQMTSAQESYAEQKIQNVTKVAPRAEDESTLVKIEVERTNLANDQAFLVEVTLYIPRTTIRAEQLASTVEEGIDLIEEKLRRQLKRYKAKMYRWGEQGEWLPESTLEGMESAQLEESEPRPAITHRKRYESTRGAMSEEEAIEKLELLGHDFYLFENADTGRFSVLYRRYEGSYGVIEPLKDGENKEEWF